MKAALTILDAIDDPQVFAPWFRERETWAAWLAFLAALFGLPMTAEQERVYRLCTGRGAVPTSPFNAAWLICGRRAGKSFTLALIAVFLACFHNWRPYLQPGERATVMIIAADRRQARTILRYVGALLNEVPMLSRLVERETAESFDLANSVSIEIATASFRRTRGYAICAALLDELAFWPTDDAASPDFEVINAILPGMAQFQGKAMLLCASSPYSKRGALWDAYRRHYGHDDPAALVWQAPTRTMNPTIPQSLIDAECERDPAHAAAEYLAQFRDDITGLLSREAIMECVERGARERPPLRQYRYVAFFDAAGGSGQDSAALAIGHVEGDVIVLDCLVERKPPFSPEAITQEFCDVLRRYRVSRAHADKWGAEWVVESFKKNGVYLAPTEKPKSDLYANLVPIVNSRAISLIENERAVHQLSLLERRVGKSGRDLIDHPPNGHDDIANVIAGLAFHAKDARRPKQQLVHQGVGQWQPHTQTYGGTR